MRYIDFENIEVCPEWCFNNVRSVEQWTHGYHRYPAKFLPNLVKKLIEEQTTKDDTIVDLFAGCGTTLVESKIHGRASIGVDINPVAELITKVKTNPVEPAMLSLYFERIADALDKYNPLENENRMVHERIDYWFSPENKARIAFLYDTVLSIKKRPVQDFFLVSLSHILKNCSRWLQSSTKPQIDPNKKITDPFSTFQLHTKQMLKKNEEFYLYLQENKYLDTKCEIKLEDARKTSIGTNSVGAVITSPPYVTSYEYADIHQLTAYWYNYVANLAEFRKNFIGTFYSQNQQMECNSKNAQKIVSELQTKDERTAKEVANYFNDMEAVGKEMYRIVKKEGCVCIVIGNTTIKDVKIKSAEVFFEILKSVGFKRNTVIKRSIPHKLMPTIRDKDSGKFTKLDNTNHKLVYPEEYILILKK
ncbi:MAG: site-specific DNA-methyltransferase [Dysgonamonadaceae bacterium]|jgi:DNA modification methylase|nr:site-specific DNA-methyltransferase [Dysgonamonadaceae bacterium]